MARKLKEGTPLGERLKIVRGALSREALAELLESSENTIGNYERGDRMPDADFLSRLKEKMGISIDWLLTGQGQMIPGDFVQAEGMALAPGGFCPRLHEVAVRAALEWLDERRAELKARNEELDLPTPALAGLLTAVYEALAEDQARLKGDEDIIAETRRLMSFGWKRRYT